MTFRGSFVALITPFDRKGRLDLKSLEQLVQWQIEEGTDGIVCAATTGEGVSLSPNERKKVAEYCLKTASGKVPILVSTGTSDTQMTVKQTEAALKQGAAGCLVVTPYYNKPSQRGCVLHFQEVARVGLPIVVYHNPTRAGIRLKVETVEELSRIPQIVGFKDSGYDLEFVRKIVRYLPVFSGDDDLTYPILREGGAGAIGVSTNLFPRGWKRMVSACLEGRWEEGLKLFQRYIPFFKANFQETNPQGIKFAVSWVGRCQPIFRLPMVLPTEEVQKEIQKAIVRLALPYVPVGNPKPVVL